MLQWRVRRNKYAPSPLPGQPPRTHSSEPSRKSPRRAQSLYREGGREGSPVRILAGKETSIDCPFVVKINCQAFVPVETNP